MKDIKFESDRLLIRPLEEHDFEIWDCCMRSLLKPQNLFDDAPEDEKSISKFEFGRILEADKKSIETGFSYNFFAFSKQSGDIVGTSQLWAVLRFNCQRAIIGFSIFNNQWRNGYGLELAQATINYGIRNLGLNRIEAEILPDNLPSISLCQKAGMKSEGIRRQALFENGVWEDHAVYAITASDIGLTGRTPGL